MPSNSWLEKYLENPGTFRKASDFTKKKANQIFLKTMLSLKI